MKNKKAVLVLEDGKAFEGNMVCGEECSGEVVFNTGMTGYQEIVTDPSYAGQIVTMTYPHIGNYGYSKYDNESHRIFASGLIVKEFSNIYSNWRADSSFLDFAIDKNLSILEGIDTRALTKHIRTAGAMRGFISSADMSSEDMKRKALEVPDMDGRDLATEVSTSEAYDADQRLLAETDRKYKYKVVAIDYGIKWNILRLLSDAGCDVEVVNSRTNAKEILDRKPNGIFLSNGPGDPAAVGYAIKTIKELLGIVPIFGICLGHQLLSLALGFNTFKLKFGHRGINHPVMNLKTSKVEITSQNHGFAVEAESMAGSQVNNIEITHVNLNDKTVEGIKCSELKAFSVQYHPEAGPGPHDSRYLFNEFVKLMESSKVG